MESIQDKIKEVGGRCTKLREKIMEMLTKKSCFLSKSEITLELKKQGIEPDRSTIYRELNFLVRNNLVIEEAIAGIDYYEIPSDHHHHLICLGCNSIKKVDMENYLEMQEKQIAKKNNFQITHHALEFYGYCQNCKN